MNTEVISEETTQPVEEVQAEETSPKEQGFSAEEEARYGGWVPQNEFRGPKETWLDAETFVRRGREINPILRANNDRLKQSLNALEHQNRVYAEQIRELKEAQIGINQRDFDTTLSIKNKQRMAAMKAGDEDMFLRLDQEIASLLLRKGELIGGKPSQIPIDNSSDTSSDSPAVNTDPVFSQWVTENDWYGRDEFRTVAVNRIAEQMRDHYPNLNGRPFLDAVLRNATKRYPEDFGVFNTPSRRAIGDFSEPSSIIDTGRGKTERDLPSDAKAAMAAFVADKLGTKEEYLRLYFEE